MNQQKKLTLILLTLTLIPIIISLAIGLTEGGMEGISAILFFLFGSIFILVIVSLFALYAIPLILVGGITYIFYGFLKRRKIKYLGIYLIWIIYLLLLLEAFIFFYAIPYFGFSILGY